LLAAPNLEILFSLFRPLDGHLDLPDTVGEALPGRPVYARGKGCCVLAVEVDTVEVAAMAPGIPESKTIST
jgi:hypothetical protein